MAQESLGAGRKIIAGEFGTRQTPLAAGTYYLGMRLEYNGTTKVNEAITSGLLSGIYNGSQGRVLSVAGEDNVIVNGDISHDGIVDGSNVAVVLTEDQIQAYRVAGFYVKEN